MNDQVNDLLAERKARLELAVGRALEITRPEGLAPLSEREWNHLQGEAEDLYTNELEWENLMQEETLDGGALTEMTFPGFLALIRGLLLDKVMPDSLAEAKPRPEVVETILTFLAGRALEIKALLENGAAEDSEQLALEHALTVRLIDLVMIQLYGVSMEQMEMRGASEGKGR